MPELLHQELLEPADPRGALTCSLVAFHPSDGERLVFSWSDLTIRGPGISRTGIGPPSMRTAWSVDDPFGTTDDPERMRTWSSYIDEDCLRVEELLSMDPAALQSLTKADLRAHGVDHLVQPGGALCGPPPDTARRQIFRRRSLENRRLGAVHTWRAEKQHPGKTLVGQVGCGDTTMNLWHVAVVQDASDTLTFLYLDDERIYDRAYPCLVGWRDRPDRPVSFEEAVRFGPGNRPGVWIDDRDRTTDIEFAVAGKPLVSGTGKPIPLNQVTHFFADLRHLLSLPRLTPTPPTAGPVVMFGREVTADLWLGEKQLLDDVNLQRAACKGPVLLDRLYGGLSVTGPYLEKVLLEQGYRKWGGAVQWQPGEFRIDADGHGFEIYFREAPYPWNILAVGRYREGKRQGQSVLLSLACGGRSGRTHFTLRQAVTKLGEQADRRAIGLQGAVLLDEGGDVFQKVDHGDGRGLRATPLDPLPPGEVFACQRRLVRCCFFFARD